MIDEIPFIKEIYFTKRLRFQLMYDWRGGIGLGATLSLRYKAFWIDLFPISLMIGWE